MVTKGNCYICGQELGKTAMKNHILKLHSATDSGQACVLLKIEGAYDKDYWLFVDVPLTASLATLDRFLRDIWLECCGHLSAFSGRDRQEIGKSRKFSTFEPGEQFLHEYDFGSTTETLITMIGRTSRSRRGLQCGCLRETSHFSSNASSAVLRLQQYVRSAFMRLTIRFTVRPARRSMSMRRCCCL